MNRPADLRTAVAKTKKRLAIAGRNPARITNAFHLLFYSRLRWQDTRWMGVPALKCPLDLWIYQEILWETRPDLVIETGTAAGGSGLFLASMLDLLGGDGRVFSVDIDARDGRPSHDRLTYVTGSSSDPSLVERMRGEAEAATRTMVILDSDHSQQHVAAELAAYGPLVSPGCYLIVEDTNIYGHPVLPERGPGPMEALDEFLAGNREFAIDPARERYAMTFNPRGYLKRTG